MKPLKIPGFAKTAAKKSLKNRKRFPIPPGLTLKEALAVGVLSGVEMAKKIIRSKTLRYDDALRVARFYHRFKNIHSKRSEVSMGLWGGRKFGIMAASHVRKRKK